jgi:hypothetical protein
MSEGKIDFDIKINYACAVVVVDVVVVVVVVVIGSQHS